MRLLSWQLLQVITQASCSKQRRREVVFAHLRLREWIGTDLKDVLCTNRVDSQSQRTKFWGRLLLQGGWHISIHHGRERVQCRNFAGPGQPWVSDAQFQLGRPEDALLACLKWKLYARSRVMVFRWYVQFDRHGGLGLAEIMHLFEAIIDRTALQADGGRWGEVLMASSSKPNHLRANLHAE